MGGRIGELLHPVARGRQQFAAGVEQDRTDRHLASAAAASASASARCIGIADGLLMTRARHLLADRIAAYI